VQPTIPNELRKRALTISPAGVRCVWQRHELANMELRLKALETKVAQEGVVLAEAQLAALERKREDQEAHGEFESEHPGYCGAQDVYYVGNLKDDTYSKVAFAKLYDRKTPMTSRVC
jgi:hypothetical protein